MATRKIKDAKDMTTQELIYFKGHAKATFMSDGATVEDSVRAIENATYKNKGYYATLAELQSAFPQGSVGSRAYVGSAYPYSIYLWQNGAWVDSGATGGEEELELGNYYNKTEVDAQVTELSEEIKPVPKELNFVSSQVLNVTDAVIKQGEKFSFIVNSDAEWSQLAIFGGAEWTGRTKIEDFVQKGVKYEIIASENINGIKAFLISAPQYNIVVDITIDFGSISSKVDENKADIQTLSTEISELSEDMTELSEEISEYVFEAGALTDLGEAESDVVSRSNYFPCKVGDVIKGYVYRIKIYDEKLEYIGEEIPSNEYDYSVHTISTEKSAYARILVLNSNLAKDGVLVNGVSIPYLVNKSANTAINDIRKNKLDQSSFDEFAQLIGIKIGNFNLVKGMVHNIFVGHIKSGERYTIKLESASSWGQLGVFYGGDWSDASRRLLNNAVNGEIYEFTATEDITSIQAFLISSDFAEIKVALTLESNLPMRVKELEDKAELSLLPFLCDKADNLTENMSLKLTTAPNSKNHHTIGAGLEFTTFGRIRISHGLETYAFGMIEIDANNVYEYGGGNITSPTKTIAHGLSIEDFLRVSIRKEASVESASVILTTLNGENTIGVEWRGCQSEVILTNVYGTYRNVSLTMGGNAYKKDIWIYGDSYADYWIPNLYEKGIKEFYADAYSGRNSANGLVSFQNALQLGTPKILVWMLGMNDADSGEVNTNYKTAFDKVKSLCKTRNISFVPCTIPNTPTQTHIYKNQYVRENANNYIDFAKILGADVEGSPWFDGLIATDNVHPSNQGKAVIANALIEHLF